MTTDPIDPTANLDGIRFDIEAHRAELPTDVVDCVGCHIAVNDVPALITEIERLRSVIERYADQLRRDAQAADDGVAVGLLRAADGLGDLLAADAAEVRPQNDPWAALDEAMRPVIAQAIKDREQYAPATEAVARP